MIVATVVNPFGPGPFVLEVDDDLSLLGDDDRLIIEFSDFVALFTVIGRARGAVHFGAFLTPWTYAHWRAEHRKGQWSLATTDRVAIARLAKFYDIKLCR